MTPLRRVVVGIGELLWDLLPSGARLGGAPANFAYIASLLGASSAIASRVGGDDLGKEALRILQTQGLDVRNIQIDPQYPTGSVKVSLSPSGTPTYSIVENVAWDHLRWSTDLAQLAATTNAVCFGTLAQRCAVTRNTIHKFLDLTPADCLRILDVNCRSPFCSREVLAVSLPIANVLKLSSEELPLVLEAASMSAMPETDAAVALQQKFGFRAVCITRGAQGSVVAVDGVTGVHPGIKVDVADTVGAGDAFVAAIALSLLNGLTPGATSEAANRIAAWVSSRHGAMPVAGKEERAQLIALLQQSGDEQL